MKSGFEHNEQMRTGDQELGIAHQHPAAKGARMCEVKRCGERGAELTQGVPNEGVNPGTEHQRSLTKAGPVRRAVLGIAAGYSIERDVVNADAIALLVMLAGAELVQEVERCGGVVMENKESVPAILSSRCMLAHDDGAHGACEPRNGSRRFGDLDSFGFGTDVATRLVNAPEGFAGQSFPRLEVGGAPRRAEQEDGLSASVEATQRGVGFGGRGVEDQPNLTRMGARAHDPQEGERHVGEGGVAARDEEVHEAALGWPVEEEELLDSHPLVADRVEAFGNAELARKARNGMLIQAQRDNPVA